jgi:hypothetical protein
MEGASLRQKAVSTDYSGDARKCNPSSVRITSPRSANQAGPVIFSVRFLLPFLAAVDIVLSVARNVDIFVI